MTQTYLIMFHGAFDGPQTAISSDQLPAGTRIDGFYSHRLVSAADATSAIARGEELLRDELVTSWPAAGSRALEIKAENWSLFDPAAEAPGYARGFTFYEGGED